MCGIAGILSSKGITDNHFHLSQKMSAALIHRGPDSQDSWLDSRKMILLVHCRLAIQDLSPTGHQPMSSSSKRFTIVYNGEIYNFLTIRKELKNKGIEFYGRSDTEVLLEAIELWGISETLKKCHGMFSFALWDNKEQKLTFARDRMGEKPLYYGIIDGNLYFASELKAIFSIQSPKKLTLDKGALASYLRYGYISAPSTIFKEIRKLEPGKMLTFDLTISSNKSLENQFYDKGRINSFWSLNQQKDCGFNEMLTDEVEAKNALDGLLNNIIREQCIADVPLGAFLSGGIDSSLVSALLQANSSRPIDTFTIGFHEKSFNEAEHAKRIAKHIGSNHHELYVNPQAALDVVPNLSRFYDEPFADSSQIPMYLVSMLAKDTVSVCLSGDGGDELFMGYNRYHMTENAFKKINKIPEALRFPISKSISAFPPSFWDSLYQLSTHLLRKKGSANMGLKIQKLGGLFQYSSLTDAYRYMSGYWQDPKKIIKGAESETRLLCSGSFETDFIDTAMLWDQLYYLPGDNLVKSDRASMAVSLEMRLPLLDQSLVEFSWKIPSPMKYKDGKSKWLLREVLYRYVPKTLIERPKMGFSVPVAHWLRNELLEWASSLLSTDTLKHQGVFNVQPVQEVFNQHLSGKYDHSHKLWALLIFQSWYQNYLE